MDPRLVELMNDVERCPGASEEALQSLAEKIGSPLPGEYLEWMRLSNGGEGFLGQVSYLMLWPTEEILERNQRLEVPKLMPGFVIFGSNGGDAAYAFDVRSGSASRMPIIEIPYIDIGTEGAARFRGDTFRDFLEFLSVER